ncbi:MAG: hypothetical protein CVV45_17180 [Spirochaetae bacterium HGW-Spirochaetae-10]|nr:MAG: hypothetical protein CVV45_17180 [Spirochaetae bacterium HGW-Spirochaetae-10]
MSSACRQSKFRKHARSVRLLAWIGMSLMLASCFEYEEKIVFHRDFSGVIEFNYMVPIDEETGKSLIAFLPSQLADVKSRYNHLPVKPELQDFVAERIPGEPFQQAKVSYRIRFREVKELETYLPGDTQIFQGAGTLRLYRSFPGLESGTEGRQIRVYRMAYRTILEQLKGRTMKFTIVCPWYFDLSSNQGTLPSPGVVYFAFPLDRTMLQPKETLWSVEIKANPSPEEGLKTQQGPGGPLP